VWSSQKGAREEFKTHLVAEVVEGRRRSDVKRALKSGFQSSLIVD